MKLNSMIVALLLCALQVYPQFKTPVQSPEQEFNSRKLVSHKILDNGFNLTEIIKQEWINSGWNNISRSSYFYDADNISSYAIIEIWENNQWVNDIKTFSVCDVNGNTTEEITQSWDDPDWVNSVKLLYEYDVSQNTTLETYQTWNALIWVNDQRYQYEFTNNKLTEKLYQKWNGTSWVNNSRYKYTYTADNLLEELYQTWDNGWINSTIVLNSYDIQNNRIESLNKSWEGNDWLPVYRFSSEYSNENLTVVTLQEGWLGTEWSNLGSYTQIYNNNNSIIEYTSHYWDSVDGWIKQQHWILSYTTDNILLEWVTQFWQSTDWGNYSRLKSVFDINGNLTIYAWEMWENSNWANHIQLLMFYAPITSVDNRESIPQHFTLGQNFPNPFTSDTKISWNLANRSHVGIKIFDAKGREIKTLVDENQSPGEHQVIFNAEGLPAGMYFVWLQNEKTVEVGKLIKE